MNLLILYLLLTKATLTSFSGLGSLPVIHGDFVVRTHLLSERQLNEAVAAGRTGPGPLGLYVVCIGYQVAGWPGAGAGFLAVITPTLLVIPVLRFFLRGARHPALRGSIRALLLAAAGLLISSALPLSRDSITGILPALIASLSFALIAFTKVETVWVIAGAAIVGLSVR
jgi:chromate transporter